MDTAEEAEISQEWLLTCINGYEKSARPSSNDFGWAWCCGGN